MALDKSSPIGFVGAGFVGGSLALAFAREGYRVVAASSRSLSSAWDLAGRVPGCAAHGSAQQVADAADVVFVTTPDDAISAVAREVSWRSGQGVVHCSGAASLDVLEPAAKRGAIPGAFHPVQAFSSVENGAKSLPGTTFGIEGGEEMRRYLSEAAEAVGGHPVFIQAEDKTLYHVSAVLMGNLLTVLAATAAQTWDKIGLTRDDGVKALAPMMRQVSVNLGASGVPGAVAGPYVRGDIGTVRKHLEALKARAPDMLPLYCELALAGLAFTMEKGTLDREKVADIRRLLEEHNPRTSRLGAEQFGQR